MPSKKKKYNARFPAGRIKKIMQTDEEVGKVAQAVPIIISRTLELFVASLLTKTLRVTNARHAKTISPSHMKQCIMSEKKFDFLRELVKNIPDINVNEEASECLSPGPSNENSTSASSSPSTSSRNYQNTNDFTNDELNKQLIMNISQDHHDKPTTSTIYDNLQQPQLQDVAEVKNIPMVLNFYKEIPEISSSSVIQHTSNTLKTTAASFDNKDDLIVCPNKKLKRFDSAPSSLISNDIRPFYKIDIIQKPNTPVINNNKLNKKNYFESQTAPIITAQQQPIFNYDLSNNILKVCPKTSTTTVNTDTAPSSSSSSLTSNTKKLTRSLIKTNIIKKNAIVPELTPIVKIDLSTTPFSTNELTIPIIYPSTSKDLPPSPPIISANLCNNTPIVKIDYSNITLQSSNSPPLPKTKTTSSSTSSFNNNKNNNNNNNNTNNNNNHNNNNFNDVHLPSSTTTCTNHKINNNNNFSPIINIDLSNMTTSNLVSSNKKIILPSSIQTTTNPTINSSLDMDEDYDNI